MVSLCGTSGLLGCRAQETLKFKGSSSSAVLQCQPERDPFQATRPAASGSTAQGLRYRGQPVFSLQRGRGSSPEGTRALGALGPEPRACRPLVGWSQRSTWKCFLSWTLARGTRQKLPFLTVWPSQSPACRDRRADGASPGAWVWSCTYIPGLVLHAPAFSACRRRLCDQVSACTLPEQDPRAMAWL